MREQSFFRLGIIFSAGLMLCCLFAEADAIKEDNAMAPFESPQFRFFGSMGDRIRANLEHWLLRAPDANPGMLEMFYRRDRHLPYETPVPWAGEFAGKYLISAVQALRMTEDPQLREQLVSFVAALMAAQDQDGYLGPWPKHERLLGHWDLWGHYHVMLGLLLWHEATGDPSVLDSVRRMADYVCEVYPEGGRSPIEAGTPAMNLSMIHGMALLHRLTGETQYLDMARRFETDLAKDGDWLRKGAAGVPYHQLPGSGPRWESLHIVLGLIELYRIEGEAQYRDAALNLWNSIRVKDRHPSGAFSTHEQAYGTIHALGSIETCCTVAWMALSVDVLRLTGDPAVADELEQSTWNQCLAAQHPSGSWCTYDTPMNGVRAPSYHQINFQYRPGSPELNCCSVNAPRGLGMLSEWAILRNGEALVLNYYGPSEFTLTTAEGKRLLIRQETAYPVDGAVKILVTPESPVSFPLRLRIPAWSLKNEVKINGAPVTPAPEAGSYLTLERTWSPGDSIVLTLDMAVRAVTGEPPDRFGKAALLRGPLLLAFDTCFNEIEMAQVPPAPTENISLETLPVEKEKRVGRFAPMGLWRLAVDNGESMVLCDFASAGAHGTEYAAWLPAARPQPVPVTLRLPEDGAEGAPGAILFRWEAYLHPEITYCLCIARDVSFDRMVLKQDGLQQPFFIVEDTLRDAGDYYWKVVAGNAYGTADNLGGPSRFRVNPDARQVFSAGMREDGAMIDAPMHGDALPLFGVLDDARQVTPADDQRGVASGALRFDGGMARYRLPFFPETAYSAAAWIRPEALDTPGLQQVFSAWSRPSDDPLRITIERGAVHARVENSAGFVGTAGVPLRENEWTHVAAVVNRGKLTLYVNGSARAEAGLPARIQSQSIEAAFGANPRYTGGEYFKGCISDGLFYARALDTGDIKALAAQ